MKSKNMTLMVVAIGCGLVAAFLTAKLSGGSGPDKIEVIVAKKDLPVGTLLEEKDMENLLGTMKFEKGTLPPDVVVNAEELKGKKLNRTLKQGNYFSNGDVGGDFGIKIPEGMFQYAIKSNIVAAASGFLQAGDHVDVVLTEAQNNGKAKSGMILRDMLVLAVDSKKDRIEANQSALGQVGAVSMAVTSEQALILSTAEKRGEVKLVLRDFKNTDKRTIEPLKDIPGFDKELVQQVNGPALKTVSVVVARADVPANTMITKDNFTNFFALRELPEEGVSNKAVKDPATLWGKYVINKMEAEMTLFGNWLSDEKAFGPQFALDAPQSLEMLPFPREVVPEKPLYPRRYVQYLNNRPVYFIETSPGEFRRADPNEDVKEYPSSEGLPGKKEERVQEGDRPI